MRLPAFSNRTRGGAVAAQTACTRRFVIKIHAAALLITGLTAGCGTVPPARELARPRQSLEYRLGSGDKLRIMVFGETDLSGEFVVDDSGAISMPLIGQIKAGGQTTREVEILIINSLKDGYISNPRVAIDVLNYRPFFILGEVNRPGSYPFVSGLTILNAVAIGGGYTYRARKDRILLIPASDAEHHEILVTEDSIVYPGDIIRVSERYF